MEISTNDSRLTAYALGELNKEDRAEFEQQLARSSQLRAAVSDVRQTAALLRQTFATENTSFTLPIEPLRAAQKVTPFPGLWLGRATGMAAAAGITVVLAWQIWIQASRDPASSSINSTVMNVKLEHGADFEELKRPAFRDMANLSYGSGDFERREFVADVGTGLRLDTRRLNFWPNLGPQFNFGVSYQLEF